MTLRDKLEKLYDKWGISVQGNMDFFTDDILELVNEKHSFLIRRIDQLGDEIKRLEDELRA